jgi:hypothetical protein
MRFAGQLSFVIRLVEIRSLQEVATLRQGYYAWMTYSELPHYHSKMKAPFRDCSY